MKYLRAVLFCGSTVLLYLGLPLLGWGLTDLRGYLASGPRLGYAALVAVFGLAVGVQSLGGTEGIRGGAGEEGKLVPRQHVVRIVMVLALYALLTWLPFADRRGSGVLALPGALRWAGLALAGLGFAFVFGSGLALGKQYSAEVTIQKDHRLVTWGVYRRIRHPRYLGLLLLAVGLSLVFRSAIGLAACLPLLAALLLRVHDEELLLGREFGAAWEAYCRRSWRLLPWVY